MRNSLKISVVFSFIWIVAGCGGDVFRLDLTRSSESEIKRSMAMKTLIKISMPYENGKMQENEIKTQNKLDIVIDSSEKLKDPAKPGVFQSTETLRSAVFTISQQQKDQAEKSITMEYKEGKIKVFNKKIPEEEPENKPGFEESSKQAFGTMVKSSGMNAEITVSDRGEILKISSDEGTEKGMAESMENFSGSKGIIFPEKSVKVGDTWLEKKEVSEVAGFKVKGDPIAFELKFAREKDETLNGRKVAVFSIDYHLEKEDVKGSYGGFPITADVRDQKKIKIYFDKERKVIIKNVTDTKILILSDPSEDVYSDKKLKIDVNVENTVHSVTTEK